jgi:hypothetical protein
MKLKELNICEDDFDLFIELSPKEKIQFLFDASESGIDHAVIQHVQRLHERIKQTNSIKAQDIEVGMYRLAILSTKDEIHLNSDSIRVIRAFTRKLWNDGYILRKLDKKKSDFDFYKFYKAYKVIGKEMPFSNN